MLFYLKIIMNNIVNYIKEGLKITSKTKVNKNYYTVDDFCTKYNCKKDGDMFINLSDDVANKLTKFFNNYNDSIKDEVKQYIENNNQLKSPYKIMFYKADGVFYDKLNIECLESNGVLDDILAHITIRYKKQTCMGITYEFEDPSFNKETQKEVESFLIEILEYIINIKL